MLDILKCSVWLEEKTARLYSLLSEKIEDKYVSGLMKVVSKQSETHALMLKTILVSIVPKGRDKVSTENCVGITGEAGKATVELIDWIMGLDIIDREKYTAIVERLAFIENSIGEETYQKMLIPLVKTVLSEISTGTYTRIIDYLNTKMLNIIALEEELHENIALYSKDLL